MYITQNTCFCIFKLVVSSSFCVFVSKNNKDCHQQVVSGIQLTTSLSFCHPVILSVLFVRARKFKRLATYLTILLFSCVCVCYTILTTTFVVIRSESWQTKKEKPQRNPTASLYIFITRFSSRMTQVILGSYHTCIYHKR